MARFLSPSPACGHSACSQHYIDTGDPRCVDATALEYEPSFSSRQVGTAFAIRAALPHLTLSEALTYADPSTVQGRAFRRGGHSGFCGTGFTREAFAEGLAFYDMHWCPDEDRRIAPLARRMVKLSYIARLDTAEEETKRAYGAITRSRPMPALMVAWERFKRRVKGRIAIPSWPGTYNMPPKGSEVATARAWMRSVGLNPEAIQSFAPRSNERSEAYSHMVAMLRSEVHS